MNKTLFLHTVAHNRNKIEEKEILNKFIKIITLFVKTESDKLETTTKETNIIKDLKVNSACLVDIIIKAEDAFDIEIDDDDSIRTIGDVINVVSQKLEATV